MKKLKTWQIVLLVIFYPVGICVLIYRLWKKNELKKEAAEAARLQAEEKARKEAEREEARRREEAYRATLNREIFRVVGVTFKNPGGRSRQTILREIKREEPSTYSFSLRKYDFEGKPAVGVFYGEEQVGSISTGDLKRALSQIDRFERVESYLSQIDRFERVESYDVTGGFVYEDSDGERANYGLDIAVYFKK